MESGRLQLALGIFCVVVSSLTTTFGLFFQKIALERSTALSLNYDEVAEVTDPNRYRCITRLYWIGGFLCITIFSFVLDLYSMSTLGQAMVVPLLASLEVAENSMFAPMVLHEQFDRCRDTSAAVTVILGALLTTLFGPGGPLSGTAESAFDGAGSYAETKEYFSDLFVAPVFIAFEAVTISLLIASLVCTRLERCQRLHFLAIGFTAGCLGGQQNMFLKGVGILVTTALGGDSEVLSGWMVYVFVVGMAGLAAFQLAFLNQGLARFEALLFVPTYTILYICSGTCVGLVFYKEYKLMSGLGWAMFCVGLVLIAVSLAILGSKSRAEDQGAGARPDPMAPLVHSDSKVFSLSTPTSDERASSFRTLSGASLADAVSSRDSVSSRRSSIHVGISGGLMVMAHSFAEKDTRVNHVRRKATKRADSYPVSEKPESLESELDGGRGGRCVDCEAATNGKWQRGEPLGARQLDEGCGCERGWVACVACTGTEGLEKSADGTKSARTPSSAVGSCRADRERASCMLGVMPCCGLWLALLPCSVGKFS